MSATRGAHERGSASTQRLNSVIHDHTIDAPGGWFDLKTNKAIETLEAAGAVPDESFDLFETALILSACDRPDLDLAAYRQELAKLVARAEAIHRDGASIAHALAETIGVEADLDGDVETYDDPRNADLAWTLERRVGLPVTLGIIYLAVARQNGWTASGLGFPGHFLVGTIGEAGGVVIDPFRRGAVRRSDEVEALLRAVEGPAAQVTAETLRPISDRMVVQRLLANLDARAETDERAAEIAARRRRVSPGDAGLALEAAQRAVKLEWMQEAQAAFAAAIDVATQDSAHAETAKAGYERSTRKLN